MPNFKYISILVYQKLNPIEAVASRDQLVFIFILLVKNVVAMAGKTIMTKESIIWEVWRSQPLGSGPVVKFCSYSQSGCLFNIT